MARSSNLPEDEDKCLEKGPNRAPQLHLKDFRPLKLPLLLANSKHMSEVHIFSTFDSSLQHHVNIIYVFNYSHMKI